MGTIKHLFATHPELSATHAAWQPKLYYATCVRQLGSLALPHTPVSGFTAISDLPSTQPSVPIIVTSLTNHTRRFHEAAVRTSPTPTCNRFRELYNISNAEGVAAANLKFAQGGPGSVALAVPVCIFLDASCTVAQCQVSGLRGKLNVIQLVNVV